MNKIHHVAVICSDKETALEFYVNKLGFPVIRENYRPERDDWKIDLNMGDYELETNPDRFSRAAFRRYCVKWLENTKVFPAPFSLSRRNGAPGKLLCTSQRAIFERFSLREAQMGLRERPNL